MHLCTRHLFTGAPSVAAEAGLTVCLWCPGEMWSSRVNISVQKGFCKRSLPVFLCVLPLRSRAPRCLYFKRPPCRAGTRSRNADLVFWLLLLCLQGCRPRVHCNYGRFHRFLQQRVLKRSDSEMQNTVWAWMCSSVHPFRG